jgi:hypothetical protein
MPKSVRSSQNSKQRERNTGDRVTDWVAVVHVPDLSHHPLKEFVALMLNNRKRSMMPLTTPQSV